MRLLNGMQLPLVVPLCVPRPCCQCLRAPPSCHCTAAPIQVHPDSLQRPPSTEPPSSQDQGPCSPLDSLCALLVVFSLTTGSNPSYFTCFPYILACRPPEQAAALRPAHHGWFRPCTRQTARSGESLAGHHGGRHRQCSSHKKQRQQRQRPQQQ